METSPLFCLKVLEAGQPIRGSRHGSLASAMNKQISDELNVATVYLRSHFGQRANNSKPNIHWSA